MKRFMWISLGVLGLAVLAFVLFFDFDFLKPKIEKALTDGFNQPVVIEGKIKAGIDGVVPSLVLDGVRSSKTRDFSARKIKVSIPVFKQGYAISIVDLVYTKLKMDVLHLPVVMSGGDVVADPITGDLFGGDLKGQLSYKGKTLNVSAALKNADYSALMKGIDGDFDAQFALKGIQIPQGLNGTASFIGREGTVKGGAGHLLKAMLPASATGNKIECAVGIFKVENGVAKSTTLLFDTDAMTVTGKGSFNLATQEMSFYFEPHPRDATLVNLAVPVRVTGTFANPKIIPDATGLAKKLSGFILGAVNPAAVVIPLMDGGTDNKNPCLAYLKKQE